LNIENKNWSNILYSYYGGIKFWQNRSCNLKKIFWEFLRYQRKVCYHCHATSPRPANLDLKLFKIYPLKLKSFSQRNYATRPIIELLLNNFYSTVPVWVNCLINKIERYHVRHYGRIQNQIKCIWIYDHTIFENKLENLEEVVFQTYVDNAESKKCDYTRQCA
jgi:hypothetical protein